ncbi:MAG: Dihydroorotate dehydrogenase [Geminicoccaceae bacterium]|nr:Dihydroorotate dehydrogenase [Geminicoccaceae bacterium]
MPLQDLSRELFGRRFQNPVLLAAGTAGFGKELYGVLDLERLGGLITKAVSLESRSGNAAPRVAEFPGGMLNSVGLANPGVRRVREEYLPWLSRLSRAQVLVNVVGFTAEEYADVIGALEGAAGIAGFELNLSCPNTHAGGIGCTRVTGPRGWETVMAVSVGRVSSRSVPWPCPASWSG